MVNLWAAGDNNRDGVLSADITVDSSYYYEPCDPSEGRLYWEARTGIFTNGGPSITPLGSWTPRANLVLSFPWDSCTLTPPFVDCSDWEFQNIGHELVR